MSYLIRRASNYYYNRRVPKDYQPYDARGIIRVALNTDCRKTALRLALSYDDSLQAYWSQLKQTGATYQECEYKSAIERTKQLGFAYHPAGVLSELPIKEVVARIIAVQQQATNQPMVQAILGGVEQPSLTVNDALTRFWDLSKDRLINKSPNQIRKWKNPRIKAIRNFVSCVGNKALNALTRDDILKFRDWWISRIQNEGLISGSANKDLIYVKVIISTVIEDLRLNIDTNHIFKKIIIRLDDAGQRPSFDFNYLKNVLLDHNNYDELNDQAKHFLFAFAETGAGPSELTGLEKEDIVLNHEIPHIIIRPRKNKALKTKFRTRTIPLVGFALEAFKKYPEGFTQYKDRPDALSAILGKYLSIKQLLPTEKHTIYSLRHSFQDRLLSVNAPDRVQADLMGHKFNRQAYGEGATLAQKLDWLKRISLLS